MSLNYCKITKKRFFLKKKPRKFAGIKKTHYFCTRFQEVTDNHWRDGRVVDYSSLENCRAERHRGFESLSLRNKP